VHSTFWYTCVANETFMMYVIVILFSEACNKRGVITFCHFNQSNQGIDHVIWCVWYHPHQYKNSCGGWVQSTKFNQEAPPPQARPHHYYQWQPQQGNVGVRRKGRVQRGRLHQISAWWLFTTPFTYTLIICSYYQGIHIKQDKLSTSKII